MNKSDLYLIGAGVLAFIVLSGKTKEISGAITSEAVGVVKDIGAGVFSGLKSEASESFTALQKCAKTPSLSQALIMPISTAYTIFTGECL